jgi:AcrR family transcriptional regulator
MTTPVAIRPQRADARRNRELILVAAKKVFAEEGTEAHMEVVARRAGVGVGTLYRHFPTKGDLLGELVAEQFATFNEQARTSLETVEDPWEALAGTLRANAERASENVAVQNAITGSEVNWERVEPIREELLEVTTQLIANAHKAGVVRDDLEVSDIPTVMCGVCSTMGKTRPDGVAQDWRRHLEILLDGLRARC